MFRFILLFLIASPVFAAPRIFAPPGSWYYDNTWQQAQIMHLQTQRDLQAQDQYRRALLNQDQQYQLQQVLDRQNQMDYFQNNRIIYDHSDRLRLYGNELQNNMKAVRRKQR